MPQRRRMAATRSGVSSPCSWIRSGATAASDGVEERVVGIDGEGDDPGAAARLVGERLGEGGRDVARALGEEHEAHVVGPAGQRRLERRLGLQPADLDFCGHGVSGARIRLRERLCRGGERGNREWGVANRGLGPSSARVCRINHSLLPTPYSPPLYPDRTYPRLRKSSHTAPTSAREAATRGAVSWDGRGAA